MSATNVNINTTGYGLCSISLQGETILANGKAIGVTIEQYNALVDEHEEWYQILVDNKLIEPELTEEEILAEMQSKLEKSEQALKKSAETQEESNKLISELIDRLDKLEKGVQADVQKSKQSKQNDEQSLSTKTAE